MRLAPGFRVLSDTAVLGDWPNHYQGGLPRVSWTQPKISGGDIEEVIPDPIPNSEVKLLGADGTARET